ncbi:hypothetical protein DFR59_1138 [Falsibacillus pallidus]|uniref:Uncharacterized protein n=1 Tax=Falsibacillus pallidus TaxID=493781 RepID=A0A370G892_9BACI|nr:hypothetical protein DFR59_1138 [Falsibacillus pallidus]
MLLFIYSQDKTGVKSVQLQPLEELPSENSDKSDLNAPV